MLLKHLKCINISKEKAKLGLYMTQYHNKLMKTNRAKVYH